MPLIALAVWQWSRLLADFKEKRVLAIRGHITLDIRPRKHKASYFVTIRYKDSFQISKRALLAFRDGEPYTIYYTPHARMVVSAEPLRK